MGFGLGLGFSLNYNLVGLMPVVYIYRTDTYGFRLI